MREFRFLAVCLMSALLTACGGGGGGGGGGTGAASGAPAPDTPSSPPPSYVYEMPDTTDDGWPVGHLDDNGIDSSMIVRMMNRLLDDTYTGIDSVAIARNGNLLLYELMRQRLDEFDPWIDNRDLSRHVMHSTSKSVTSALVGIAIDQGYIAGTDTPFYDLFSYGSYARWDERKADMTLEDVLTMRLGMEWDEWTYPYTDSRNSLAALTSNSRDYARSLLGLPMVAAPGTQFVYNTAATIALGQAVENAVGVPLAQFAELHLFQPLQINHAEWLRTPTGLPNGGSGLFLKTRAMVKFGQLFLDGGIWQGVRVISEEWVEKSVAPHVTLDWDYTNGYGYQWWLGSFRKTGEQIPAYSTRGYGGQFIFVVPSLQLVVAFTGRNYGSALASQPYDLMELFIVRATTPE